MLPRAAVTAVEKSNMQMQPFRGKSASLDNRGRMHLYEEAHKGASLWLWFRSKAKAAVQEIAEIRGRS